MKFLGISGFSVVLLAVSGAPATFAAESGDAVAGAKKNSMCQGCHGIPGYKNVFPEHYSVPKIGGQHSAYIAKALQEYKAGNRNHATMRAIASGLSEQDIADLAAYYGADAPKPAAK